MVVVMWAVMVVATEVAALVAVADQDGVGRMAGRSEEVLADVVAVRMVTARDSWGSSAAPSRF